MNTLVQLITENDNWSVAEGVNEGTPFLLRYRPHLQPFIETGIYNTRLVIIWPYESDNTFLMPGDEDMELMGDVENALAGELEKDAQCVLAFIYIGQGQKEWHWHSSDIEETEKRINEAFSNFEKLPLELLSYDDPEWSEYNSVLEGSVNAEEKQDDDK